MNQLRISEIFSSVQGEGIHLGVPSTFIRTSGCNLRCVWCDTPYASWNPEGPMMDIQSIVGQALALKNNHVVITGGEPMLFDPIQDLVAELQKSNHSITMETAGTIHRHLPGVFMSISPKPAHSAPPIDTPNDWHSRHESTRFQPKTIVNLIKEHDYQFKFVVKPEEQDSIIEVQRMIHEIELELKNQIPPTNLFLMPEGRDTDTLHHRLKLLVPICQKTGFRLAPRLQIDLFGDTRGT
ncbi:MAG: 7-carboxy-7-deazaguanine synthase QueE [Fimbriimonadaceae bacterium]